MFNTPKYQNYVGLYPTFKLYDIDSNSEEGAETTGTENLFLKS